MKVCFFSGGLSGGGIGRVTSIIANGLAQFTDLEISVLCYSQDEKEDYSLCSGVKKDYLLSSYTSMTRAILNGAIPKLRKYLKKNEVDVVIGCGILYSFLPVIACMGINTRCINWEHSSMAKVNNDFRFQSTVRSFVAKKASLNIVLTKKTREQYIRTYHLKEDKVVQIYNPVDPEAFQTQRYDSVTHRIVTVGRLCFQKRMEDIIPIALALRDAEIDFQWDIFGEGEDRAKLEELIAENKLSDFVSLRGRVSDIYNRYGNYACIIMTSRYEGFPMTLLEAAANGLPMISYDIETGPDEIICDGENGYLIPSGDTEIMAEKIISMMRKEDTRVRLSNGSKKTALDFSLESIITAWAELLERHTGG